MLATILQVLFLIVCIGIIASVLLQSGKSAGISGAIGGGAETFFGKKKGLDETFEKATIFLGVAFVVLSMVLTIISG